MQIGRLISFALICCVGTAAASIGPGSHEITTIQTRTIQRVVHLSSPGAHDSRYAYVAFHVPAHAVRLSVSYEYERANQTTTIDIGLFDARSNSATDPRGFRGWSGGRRSEFFVSRNDATPGYMPGPMPVGTWRIILGLYRVRPEGVDVSFNIKIEIDENRSRSSVPLQGRTNDSFSSVRESGKERPSSLQKRPGGRVPNWWRGDLHMHTVHSDGDWTIDELISSARNIGLDFISITDHNTASHHPEIDRALGSSLQPLVLRGEEITTYGGHANAWGLPSGTWIDFRTRPGDTARILSIAARVHRLGALISINHPFGSCSGCAWSYDAAAREFDAIEVWNGVWDQTDEKALMMWDKVLRTGRRITAIASSDSHRASNPIGQPTTNVRAIRLLQEALLDALRRGRVYLTSEVARPIVKFEAEPTNNRGSRWMIGDEAHLGASTTIRFFVTTEGVPPDATISLISNGQVIRHFLAKTDGPIEIKCPQDTYFRLEVRDKKKAMLALTNPIYVKIGRRR